MARQAQGPPARCKIVDRSKQRTYGKQGSSAASRATLKDYMDGGDDENTIERRLKELDLSQRTPSELQPIKESPKETKLQHEALTKALPKVLPISMLENQDDNIKSKKPGTKTATSNPPKQQKVGAAVSWLV